MSHFEIRMLEPSDTPRLVAFYESLSAEVHCAFPAVRAAHGSDVATALGGVGPRKAFCLGALGRRRNHLGAWIRSYRARAQAGLRHRSAPGHSRPRLGAGLMQATLDEADARRNPAGDPHRLERQHAGAGALWQDGRSAPRATRLFDCPTTRCTWNGNFRRRNMRGVASCSESTYTHTGRITSPTRPAPGPWPTGRAF